MVGLSEALLFLYGWTIRASPVFVWFDPLRHLGIRMVELLEAPRFSYGWTHCGLPVSVRLNSQRPFGFRIVGLSEAPGFCMLGLLEAPVTRRVRL